MPRKLKFLSIYIITFKFLCKMIDIPSTIGKMSRKQKNKRLRDVKMNRNFKLWWPAIFESVDHGKSYVPLFEVLKQENWLNVLKMWVALPSEGTNHFQGWRKYMEDPVQYLMRKLSVVVNMSQGGLVLTSLSTSFRLSWKMPIYCIN